MKWLRHPVAAGVLVSLALGLAVAAQRLGVLRSSALERLELLSVDLRFVLRGPTAPGPETVIVSFDDRSYAAAPLLFERRAGVARLVRAAKDAGAAVIGLDGLFVAPERLLSDELRAQVERVAALPPKQDDEADALVRKIHAELSGDAELAAALGEAKNVVLIMHLGERGLPDLDDPGMSRGRYGQSVLGDSPLRQLPNALTSLSSFNLAARAIGDATVYTDETSSVRAVSMARRYGQNVYAPLAVHAVALLLGIPRGRLAFAGPRHEVRLGERTVALTSRDELLLNYRGPAGTFPTFSAIDLLEGKVPREALVGKIVLLGVSQLGQDKARTPFQSDLPGVEVQATLIDNLLRGNPLRRVDWWVDALVTLLAGLAISALFLPGLLRSPLAQVVGSLVIVGGALWGETALFSSKDLWITAVGPASAFVGVSVVCLALSYVGEGLKRRELRHAFGHYLGAEVIGELLAQPGKLQLGGERRELTVLFSDIRDFTTISERLAPEELVAFLNAYLTPMTRAVLSRGGLLDKYIGDAIMAVFGAPVPRQDHAARALGTALDMHRELEAMRPRFAATGLELAIGVGVNTGDMVVGNMGSEERFDYTVAGDAVNLSSRLESLTKSYGVFCLVGRRSRDQAGAEFQFREIDLVQVKGKKNAQEIFELLGGQGRTIASYASLERFTAAVAAWRRGEFVEARRGFTSFLQENPADPVAKLYLERLSALGDVAPAEWTGVFVHTSK